MKEIWTLRYDRSVTAFLQSMRGTDTYTEIHEAIKALQYRENPAENCRVIPEASDMYEFEVAGYWVGIRIIVDDKAVRVLYITIE